jgi:hypothetical protein
LQPNWTKPTNVLVDTQLLPHQLNLCIGVVHKGSQTLLNALHLLRHGTEDSLFQAVELVKTTPGADLTETDEDTPHRLKVKRLVATENENKATELYT